MKTKQKLASISGAFAIALATNAPSYALDFKTMETVPAEDFYTSIVENNFFPLMKGLEITPLTPFAAVQTPVFLFTQPKTGEWIYAHADAPSKAYYIRSQGQDFTEQAYSGNTILVSSTTPTNLECGSNSVMAQVTEFKQKFSGTTVDNTVLSIYAFANHEDDSRWIMAERKQNDDKCALTSGHDFMLAADEKLIQYRMGTFQWPSPSLANNNTDKTPKAESALPTPKPTAMP